MKYFAYIKLTPGNCLKQNPNQQQWHFSMVLETNGGGCYVVEVAV